MKKYIHRYAVTLLKDQRNLNEKLAYICTLIAEVISYLYE